MQNHYDAPGKTPANFVALSPISFLKRAATVYGPRAAVTYGTITRTWAQTALRCRAIAAALTAHGIKPGDTVSVLSPNTPQLYELQFAVPMAGAVLNTINTRLEPATIAYILTHSDSRLVICDTHLAATLRAAFALNGTDLPVVDITDMQAAPATGFGQTDYETLAPAR
jgi:fatty-acyl-CoA synthase